ncbi:MAG: hypothetical protein CFE26_15430 [Verrucomicrobiales bacterium VVV1]|nr:MAG: hypothetical protein CFE26_15430 [Verrucomicrobiales bacterium VVV1]
MANEHPFQALFETFGRLPSAHAESINRRAYEQLWSVLAVGPDHAGRCILLKAPRAGHGKTHLLSRLQHHLGNDHEFIPLYAASGSFIAAASVTSDTLSRLSRALPAGGGLCILDLLVRRLFALALQPLVRSGEVPCQDREGALAALRNRPVETFDFHHPNAVTAHWARENFEVLGPRLALELAQRTGAPLREIMFWVDALFRFAATPVDHPSRAGNLIQTVATTPAQPAQVFERLSALLCLLTQLVRVVLVADDLEGFSSDESAALHFASFLGSLRHSADRVDTILSVNRDIWESAFLPRLSGGLADRLSEVVIELEPLSRDEMVALLEARATGLGERIYGRLDLSNGERHARGILRAAASAWTNASAPSIPPAEIVATPPVFAAAPASVAAAISAADLAPELPIEVPVIESSPFLSVAQSPAPQIAEPPPIVQPPVLVEPPAVHEPVVVQTEPTVDFLPPVEPVSEPEAVVIPPLFEPTPPVSSPPSYPSDEMVPVGRIITGNEFAASSTPVTQPSVIEPPSVPEIISPFLSQPLIAAEQASQSPFGDVAVAEPPYQTQQFGQPQSFNPPASPFQTTPAEPIQTPLHGETAAFAQSPAVAAPATEEPKETDRVDELLKQFRERYARG